MLQPLNRLSQLILRNRGRPRRYEVKQAADAQEATVYLYDVIDSMFGVGAEQFVKDLNAITAPTVHLRINSPGGDVFEGRAIATAIAQHPSTVIAHVDGLAASAASSVAMAADQVEMAPGSFIMIHRAWTLAMGNAQELLEVAALLEKIDGSLAQDYATQTGLPLEQINEWLDAETWFTAEEAVENGFADSISGDDTADGDAPGEDDEPPGPGDGEEPDTGDDPASAAANWDLTVYLHRPVRRQQAAKPPHAPSPEALAQIAADEAARREQVHRILHPIA